MTPVEWLVAVIVVLVITIVLYKHFFGGPNNAMGYTRGHGHCPNMGVCNSCDICEED